MDCCLASENMTGVVTMENDTKVSIALACCFNSYLLHHIKVFSLKISFARHAKH